MTEKLVVPIEVTVARLERDLAKIAASSVATAKKVEKDFVTANDNVGKSFQRTAGVGKQQMDVVSRSLKGTGFAVSNLSAQLNDIGVSLAGGQSPFQVMIQQGTQVSQIMQQTGGSFKGFASLLGSAVGGILNPVSLVTFAIIGLGGAAVQWAMDTEDSAARAKEALDSHIKDVKNVTAAWGETVPALKEYLMELEKAREREDAKDVLTDVIAKGWANVTEELRTTEAHIAGVMWQLQDMGQGEAVRNLSKAWVELQGKITDHTATAEDANKVSAMAATLARESGVPAFQDLADTFSNLAIQIGTASDQTFDLRKELVLTQDAAARLAVLRAKALKLVSGREMVEMTDDLDARIGNKPLVDKPKKTRGKDTAETLAELRERAMKLLAGRETVEMTDDLDARLGDKETPKKERSRRASSAATPTERYEDRAATKQLEIDNINAEREALEKLNPFVEDYGRQIDYAQTKSFLLAEAKKKDVELSPQQLAAVEALANAHADATVELNKVKEAQERTLEVAKEWTATSRSALGGFIEDLRAGKTAAEAFEGALDKIADKMIDMAMDSIFTGESGSAISSFFASLFGAKKGFAKGGYTGNGGANEPAGVVHKGEYVFSADATRRIGVSNLATLHRGYKNGGYVGGAAPMIGAGSGGNKVYVNVENNISDEASAGVRGTGTPSDPLRVVIEAVKKDIAGGGADPQLRNRYNITPVRRSR